VAREESSDRAIGYGKALMVFHMLKLMGDRHDVGLFNAALRRMAAEQTEKPFLGDWQAVFETGYQEDLDWFLTVVEG
jgi:hypothetical protein